MKILAIETSSHYCSVALSQGAATVSIDRKLPLQQAQSILPMIEELLALHSVQLNQLDALAFGCGPGSFTGVRIAASIIQGFGFALNLPIIPVSSLAAIAQAAIQDLGWQKVVVAIDARIQEVYTGAYVANDNGIASLVNNEVVIKPSEMLFPAGDDWCGVGDAWEVYRNEINLHPSRIDSTKVPLASHILTLARLKYLQKAWCTPAEAIPVYLRDNVAKKSV